MSRMFQPYPYRLSDSGSRTRGAKSFSLARSGRTVSSSSARCQRNMSGAVESMPPLPRRFQ